MRDKLLKNKEELEKAIQQLEQNLLANKGALLYVEKLLGELEEEGKQAPNGNAEM